MKRENEKKLTRWLMKLQARSLSVLSVSCEASAVMKSRTSPTWNMKVTWPLPSSMIEWETADCVLNLFFFPFFFYFVGVIRKAVARFFLFFKHMHEFLFFFGFLSCSAGQRIRNWHREKKKLSGGGQQQEEKYKTGSSNRQQVDWNVT